MWILSADEERQLGQAARQGDHQARERLILANLRLVGYILQRSSRLRASGLEPDDLYSEGVVGLIEAVDRWEPDRGRRLVSLAYRRIQGAMLDAARAHPPLPTLTELPEPPPRKPESTRHQHDAAAMAHQALQGRDRQIVTLYYGLGDEPPLTQAEVAQRVGLSQGRLNLVLQRAIETLRQRYNSEG